MAAAIPAAAIDPTPAVAAPGGGGKAALNVASDSLTHLLGDIVHSDCAPATWQYIHDAATGRLLTQSAPLGTTTYGYDGAGRLVNEQRSGTMAVEQVFSYDVAGNRRTSQLAQPA